MSVHLRTKIAGLALAAAAAVALLAPAAQATTITYDFTVNNLAVPLNGNTYHGSFSYDSSSIVPGGKNFKNGLLTALNFTFNGISYNAATANTGVLFFDSDGNLSNFGFGNNCVGVSPICSVNSGTNDWLVTTTGEFANGGFIYALPKSPQNNFRGHLTYSLVHAVPEPGVLGMFCFGLLALGAGVVAKRRTSRVRRSA